MEIIPIIFKIELKGPIPIITVKGHTPIISKNSYSCLIDCALDIIKSAEKFGGIPIALSETDMNKLKPMSVKFSLIFKNASELIKFRNFLKK